MKNYILKEFRDYTKRSITWCKVPEDIKIILTDTKETEYFKVAAIAKGKIFFDGVVSPYGSFEVSQLLSGKSIKKEFYRLA